LRTKTGSIAGLKTKSKTEPEYEDIDVSVSEENFYEASLLIEFFKLIASGAAILIGAKYFVEHAVFFALLLEDPETLIGISLVAVGTSVPKLIVTVSAADSHLAFDYFLCLLVIGSRASSSKIFLIRKRIISPSSARKLYADY
jgi:Ca2+/Na+ antiporter